jgi:YidC/Oxa1 family membrane protein insertase
MPDSPESNSNPTKPAKKEMSMEIRLLLAFLLMGVVLFVSQYIYKPPVPAKELAKKPVAAETKAPEPSKLATAPAEKPQPVAGQVAGQSEETFAVETELYHIVFSNRGATVRSWKLNKFKDSAGKPLDLVNVSVLGKVDPPFSLLFPDSPKPATDLNQALFAVKRSADGLNVEFEFSDGKTSCRKSFEFSKNSYLSKFKSEVIENGAPVKHMIEWRGGFGDQSVISADAAQHSVYYDLSEGKLRTKTGKDGSKGENGVLKATGRYSFAGLEDAFFAAVFLPADNTTVEIDTYGDNLPRLADKKDDLHVGLSVGGDSVNRFSLFAGPKDVDMLNTVDPKLKELIDWGWFGVIAKPLFLVMKVINNGWIHNWGWTIVFVTVAISILLLPLRFSSMKSAKKMQTLQPQIAAINAKYKNVSLRDPRNAEKNQEVMALYKKHGVNPVGGCLPMLIQLPFFYAFYKVLAVAIELRGAPWLWVSDLSQPEHLPVRLLPTVMIVTQFFMQKMTPNPTADPSQQKMMMFMPLILGFFFYYQSSGLVLYYLTSNLVGIGTQYFINRLSAAPTPQPAVAGSPKKIKA